MTAFVAGAALGLASSAHCVVMCGPLLATVARLHSSPSRAASLAQSLLHHAGRTAVYVLLSLPAGVAGESLAVRGFGRATAIAAGVLLLLAAAGSFRSVGRLTAAISALAVGATAPLLRWSRARPVAGPLATGALNGLLPCGLVYGALTTAAASGSATGAMLLMTGFGAGTAAVLIALSAGVVALPAARRLRPLAPLALAAAAVLLLARGAAPLHDHRAPAPSVHHMHE